MTIFIYKQIHLLGLYNSGTCLVHNMFSTYSKDSGNTIIWKHENNELILRTCIENNKDCLFIVMYRPLNSWIRSMQKKAYSVTWNNKIDSKCIYRKKEYNNIADIYNEYYDMYMKFINEYSNVIYLEYNNIVNKNTSYEYIKQKIEPFSIPMVSKEEFMKILSMPSKNHGNPVNNSDEALTKINQLKICNDYDIYYNAKTIDYFEVSV